MQTTKQTTTVAQANTKEETTMTKLQTSHVYIALSDGSNLTVGLVPAITYTSNEELLSLVKAAIAEQNPEVAATIVSVTPSEEEPTMTNENLFDQTLEQAIEDLSEQVKDAVTGLQASKATQYIKALASASDNEVYDVLLNSLHQAGRNVRIAVSLRTKIRTSLKDITANANAIVAQADASKRQHVLAKVKALVALVIRKALAILEGTLRFAFDTTTILGVMVGRVAYTTVREMTFASKAIYNAFKADIWNNVKHA